MTNKNKKTTIILTQEGSEGDYFLGVFATVAAAKQQVADYVAEWDATITREEQCHGNLVIVAECDEGEEATYLIAETPISE